MVLALDYFKNNFAMLESEYPYTSGPKDPPSSDCQYSVSKVTSVKVKSTELAELTVNSLKTVLLKQPLIIPVAANNKYIHSYKSGIIDSDDCNTIVMYHGEKLNTINHAVLIVGFGTDKATGLLYVLCKNSWNTTWGD